MCINCDDNSTLIPTGPQGEQGPAGNDGIFGGFSGEWLFSTSTSTSPTSQQLRLNSATYTAVTSIYVNDTNIDSINYDLFLDSLSNDGNYGLIRIFKEYDSSIFWLGKITGVVDNGTDHSIGVTYILHNGTFLDNDNVVLTFSPRGDTPTLEAQRINTIFREQDTPYVNTASNSFLEIGTLVWDMTTYGYPETCYLVVKPNIIGHTYRIRITDNSSNIIWNTQFVAASTSKQVIDMGARLISPVSGLRYLQIEAQSDGTNGLQIHSIDLYNQ